jgi:hypothetical protein
MSAADPAVAEALDRALASLEELRRDGFQSEPVETQESDPVEPFRRWPRPNRRALPIDALAARQRPTRIARGRMSHRVIAYRSGLMWLALAAISALAIAWLTSHVG